MKPWVERWLLACSDRPRMCLGCLAAVLAVQISPWWCPGTDAVAYLSIARSIVARPHIGRLGSHQLGFPPGYPLLISPAFLTGDHPFLLLSIIHWGIAVLLMLGIYTWARRQCPTAAIFITGLVMVNVGVWNHYRRPLSELAFMTVAIWTVHILNAAVAARSVRVALCWIVPGSALLLWLSLIREVGVAFAAGFAVAMLRTADRTRMARAAIVMTLLVMLPAAAAVVAFARYDVVEAERSLDQAGTHWDGLIRPTFEGRLTEGLRLRISDVGRVLIPGMHKAYNGPGEWLNVNMAIYLLVCLVVGIGWWRHISRRADVFALSLPFYLAAYVVWPFDSATRYVLPVLPALCAGVWFAIEPWREWRSRLLVTLLVGHLAVATGYWLFIDMPRARACAAQWRDVEQLAVPLRSSSQVVLASNVPDCVRQMIEFTLDRPVRQSTNHALADADVHWVITSEMEPVEAGFALHAASGPYRLLRRDPEK